MFKKLLKSFISLSFVAIIDSVDVFGNEYSMFAFKELELAIRLDERLNYYELIQSIDDVKLKRKVRFQIFDLRCSIFENQKKREDYLSSLCKSL